MKNQRLEKTKIRLYELMEVIFIFAWVRLLTIVISMLLCFVSQGEYMEAAIFFIVSFALNCITLTMLYVASLMILRMKKKIR